MGYSKGKLIFRTILAAFWNLLCLTVIWFFVQGVITSIALDMSEYVWIWCMLIALFLFILVLSIRFALIVRQKWKAYQKA